MAFIGSFLAAFSKLETEFDALAFIDWTREHDEIPIFAVVAYLICVFYVPDKIEKAWKVRRMWCYWNLLLAIFSILGASRLVPVLVAGYMEHGVRFTVCEPSPNWYMKGPSGFWMR